MSDLETLHAKIRAREEELLARTQGIQRQLERADSEKTEAKLYQDLFEVNAMLGDLALFKGWVTELQADHIQQAILARHKAQERDGELHVNQANKAGRYDDIARKQQMLEEIREAVQQQRMHLLFQPIINLCGDSVERYEVLLRMRNREGGEMLPETVFSIAKHDRLSMVLDRWVIAHSIQVLRERLACGQSVILFVNLAPTIQQDKGLLNWLQGGLHKTKVPAANLIFEIAESTVEQNQQALVPLLKSIKELGCGISLDHFSGREGWQALVQSIQTNYVKLDCLFAKNLLKDKECHQQLGELAHNLGTLGVVVIVNGVEDARTLWLLWSSGIEYVQGFFLQPPHTDMSYDFTELVL